VDTRTDVVGADLESLYREEGPRLWRALYAYTGGRRDVADDAVAEAFARAIEHRATIRRPRPWLYRIAFRVATAEMRGERGRSELVDRGVEDPAPPAELMSALRSLSPAQRAAVYLHYRADLPVREVARLMGTSSAAVKVHLFRGRRRLAELLGEEEPDDE
jgi:RNA polymerase sigma-70 factor, ECF subfamily